MVQDRKLDSEMKKASGPSCGGSQKPGIVLKQRWKRTTAHIGQKFISSGFGNC